MSIPEPQRTSAAYRRDLFLARLVIGQLRDQALGTGEAFHVGGRTFDAAALDALWDGLDRADSHFWQVEELDRMRKSAQGRERPARAWWKLWGAG